MAPVAGRHYAEREARRHHRGRRRHRRHELRRQRWSATGGSRGPARPGSASATYGHLTGFPSVDVKSIGAGGGSIAWVDDGGLLRVGPQSAGADPGPACYGRGGARADGDRRGASCSGTSTPATSSAARSRVDADAARRRDRVATSPSRSASTPRGGRVAVLALATEQMVQAIEEITRRPQGIDPREAVLVARRRRRRAQRRRDRRAARLPARRASRGSARRSVRPAALISDLTAEYGATFRATSDALRPRRRSTAMLDELATRCRRFAAGPRRRRGGDARSSSPPRRATRARSGSSRCRCAAASSTTERRRRALLAGDFHAFTGRSSRSATAARRSRSIGWRARGPVPRSTSRLDVDRGTEHERSERRGRRGPRGLVRRPSGPLEAPCGR